MKNDLIRRNDLYSTLYDKYDGCDVDLEIIYDEIEKAPAVDAVPVRRGRWELDDKYYVWNCSECGESPSRTKNGNGTGYIPAREELWDYCPHCGALMSSEVDDE